MRRDGEDRKSRKKKVSDEMRARVGMPKDARAKESVAYLGRRLGRRVRTICGHSAAGMETGGTEPEGGWKDLQLAALQLPAGGGSPDPDRIGAGAARR